MIAVVVTKNQIKLGATNPDEAKILDAFLHGKIRAESSQKTMDGLLTGVVITYTNE